MREEYSSSEHSDRFALVPGALKMKSIKNVEAAEGSRFPNIANWRCRSQFLRVAIAQAPVAERAASSACHDVDRKPVLLPQILVFQIVVGDLTVEDCIQLRRV